MQCLVNFVIGCWGFMVCTNKNFTMSQAVVVKFLLVSGNGSQFVTLSVSIIVMALLGMFNVHRHHSMNSTALLLYAFTSCVAGYISSNFLVML